ncbi:Hypothetical_protein [Hexamita inflata]|uniref:Hypothetical_protein n=1 Tax=Hexamita inflata TaxID=28002 RepID=A0AA86NEC6_9EUKA|nr:Hypothetical protein HINF_LOCUS5300 [Hexamita inflata]
MNRLSNSAMTVVLFFDSHQDTKDICVIKQSEESSHLWHMSKSAKMSSCVINKKRVVTCSIHILFTVTEKQTNYSRIYGNPAINISNRSQQRVLGKAKNILSEVEPQY